ncbi:winged helix-turn-helix domain-containing protein [Agromyces mediolanus]|uniref:helix-turn-helix domain-containing protein n=1 Tax=Agromyces mediolanus TaxID=41986 RepID=UPI003835CB38
MPARRELESAPTRITAMQRALSGAARASVLRHVAQHPRASHTEIVASTGVSRGSATTALRDLEELGYLVVDGPREGRVVRYRAVDDQLSADLAALGDWLLG